jgi:hypothetical protein
VESGRERLARHVYIAARGAAQPGHVAVAGIEDFESRQLSVLYAAENLQNPTVFS